MLAVFDGDHEPIVVREFGDVVRQHALAVFIQNADGFLTIVTFDGVDFGTGIVITEAGFEVDQGILNLLFFGQRRTRQNHLGNLVVGPVLVDFLVEVVLGIIHGDGGLVPVGDNLGFLVEGQHVVHGGQVGLNITNHDFDLVSDTVIHFADRTGPFIDGVIGRRKVVEADVGGGFAAKSKRDLFTHGNRGLGQGQTHVTRHTNEYDAVLFGEAEGRQRLPRTRGRNIEDQFGGFGRLLHDGKQLLLVLKQHHVFVFEEVGVLLDEFVGLVDDVADGEVGTGILDDFIHKLIHVLICVGDGGLFQLK